MNARAQSDKDKLQVTRGAGAGDKGEADNEEHTHILEEGRTGDV